ncbi:MAG: hypothetical protein ACOX6T_21595 [Myxococcales bacterium]|jgi:hypothetical protein
MVMSECGDSPAMAEAVRAWATAYRRAAAADGYRSAREFVGGRWYFDRPPSKREAREMVEATVWTVGSLVLLLATDGRRPKDLLALLDRQRYDVRARGRATCSSS